MSKLLLLLLLLLPVESKALTVLGASASFAFPTCASFSMADLGTYNYLGTPNTFTQFDISTANIYWGIGAGGLGANRDLLVFNSGLNINVGPSGTVSGVDTANVPDQQNTQGASHFNATVGYFVNIGAQTTAPCGGSPCFHARFYNGTTFAGGATLSALPLSSSQRAFVFGNDVFINYNDGLGTYILKTPNTYDINLARVTIDTIQNISGLAVTGGFVYATYLPSTLKRWTTSLTGLTNLALPFSSILMSGPFLDEEMGYMYIGHNSGVTHQLHRMEISNPTVSIAQVNFAATENVVRVDIDTKYNKLYVQLSESGQTAIIKRLDRTTLTVEATYNGPSTINGPGDIKYNFIRQRAYIPMLGGGGNINAINEVRLCIFQ